MECESFRREIREDPTRSSPELEEHESSCAACSAYAVRVRDAERLIQRALRIDPDAVRQAAAGLGVPRPGRAGSMFWSGIAAVFVAGLAVQFALGPRSPLSDEELASQAVAHWDHEPESWAISEVAVSNALLERVLDGSATLDRAALGTVSYAHTCWVGRQWLPHLVVQTDRGPVMVLLFPEREVDEAIPLHLPEQGMDGMLWSTEGGSIAVLGEDEASLEPVEQRVADAVNWRI